MMIKISAAARLCLLCCATNLVAAPAEAVLVLANSIYLQDFNTLASSGTSSVLPVGWEIAETGANANGTYAAATGSLNAGNTYSFGDATSSDRALGGVASGNLQPNFGLVLSNGLSQTIKALNISYFGEVWRIGTSGNTGSLLFAYSTNAAAVAGPGSFSAFSSLNFTVAPIGTSSSASNGNIGRSIISATLGGLALLPGSSIVLRWSDPDAAGFDHGLAIDDFRLEALFVDPVPEPDTWALMIAGFMITGVALRRRVATSLA